MPNNVTAVVTLSTNFLVTLSGAYFVTLTCAFVTLSVSCYIIGKFGVTLSVDITL